MLATAEMSKEAFLDTWDGWDTGKVGKNLGTWATHRLGGRSVGGWVGFGWAVQCLFYTFLSIPFILGHRIYKSILHVSITFAFIIGITFVETLRCLFPSSILFPFPSPKVFGGNWGVLELDKG